MANVACINKTVRCANFDEKTLVCSLYTLDCLVFFVKQHLLNCEPLFEPFSYEFKKQISLHSWDILIKTVCKSLIVPQITLNRELASIRMPIIFWHLIWMLFLSNLASPIRKYYTNMFNVYFIRLIEHLCFLDKHSHSFRTQNEKIGNFKFNCQFLKFLFEIPYEAQS